MSGPYHYEQYEPPRQSVPVPVTYLAQPFTDQRPPSTVVTVIAWVVTVATGLYMLPWAIAATRGKANQWAVFVVSLLLGWTLVGWVIALVMACTAHRPLMSIPMVGYGTTLALPPSVHPAGWYPNPGGPGRRYWDGQQWTQHYA
jgi:hypothetical protein